MQLDTYIFVVWAHRSARSIFGPASNPVMLNGGFLCFNTEEQARAERDELNARSGTHVRYSVRPVRVQMNRPSGFAESQSPAPHYAAPPVPRPLPGLAATRLA
jgi:hypothetical protein